MPCHTNKIMQNTWLTDNETMLPGIRENDATNVADDLHTRFGQIQWPNKRHS